MENNRAFSSFIELIKFDQETVKLLSKASVVRKSIEKCELEKTSLLSSLESSKLHLKDAEKEVHLQELRMKDLNDKEKSKRALMSDLASNQKEYQALKRELETIKRAQHGYENELINSWNKFEAAKKVYADLDSQVNSKLAEIDKLIEDHKKELLDIDGSLKGRETDRTAKTVGIPAEWLDRYNMMSHQVPDPVVPLENSSCSACFTDLPRQDILALQKNKMLQCKGCFRLIYNS